MKKGDEVRNRGEQFGRVGTVTDVDGDRILVQFMLFGKTPIYTEFTQNELEVVK